MNGKTVGLFLITRDNDYQRLQEAEAVAAAKRLGVPIEVYFGENDSQVQVRQILDFVKNHPAESIVAVEAVDDQALAPVAQTVAKSQMGWFLLHRSAPYMDELRKTFPSLPMSMVTADQKEIGRIQGQQFVALLEGKGSVLYVRGPTAASAANDRLAGVHEAIAGTSISLVMLQGDWTEVSGERAVASWLNTTGVSPLIQMVGSQNDAMATGALRALSLARALLRRKNLLHIPVTGVDGAPDHGLLLVDRRRLAATVVMPPVAGHAVELIHRIWSTPGFSPDFLVRQPVRSHPEVSSLVPRVPVA
jgi:ribose transport system substrate-binding protein